MASNEQQPLLGASRIRSRSHDSSNISGNQQTYNADSDSSAGAWWASRSRDVLSLFTVLLLLGAGLGIWVYGTLPTSDHDEHPHEYALSTARIHEHLERLEDIAGQHNGSRSVATGHAASADYVVAQLRAHGNCDVHVQRFKSPVWTVNGEPRLSVRAPVRVDFIHEADFGVMRYGGNGANIADAPVAVVGAACAAADVGDVSGKVAIARASSHCTAFETAFLLEQLGARAVVFVRAARYTAPSRARVRIVDWKEGDPLMTVPVLSVTHSAGQLLEGADGVRVSIATDTRIDVVETRNVVCVGRTGDAAHTVLVGAHLDSVAAGPGINDNGSGAATALEIHLTLARIRFRPNSRLVFAWWGAEEDGLLGSRHFARVLAHGWKNRWTDREPIPVRWSDIALNLNFDMLASPNYIALVHNGTDASQAARAGSQRIQRVFEDYFARHEFPYQLTDMRGGSDFLPFIENGVPAGGVLAGASEIKSIDERRKRGGMARTPLDPCYHRECDTLLNINLEALQRLSRAAMYAVSTLATTPDLRGYLAGNA
ncbi:hypothetical protein H4S02_001756 [Coemansia sp. RSA 2611]|nr:hypothetical protein H4S01_002735 [Coemansia sp. RSA 2610]KAJ2390632.1 hypothetical protein H4S02_001756 [Coemansia sp. RSA 2611]